MLINQSYFIDSCDDVELNIKRESKLEYRITYDDEKEIEAIVCIIQGLGSDISEVMLGFNMKYFAMHYNVAVLSVNYHCIGNRPQTGATYFLDDIDKLILEASLNAMNLNIPFDIKSINTSEEIDDCLLYIDKQITILKSQQVLDASYNLNLSITLQPTKNEYMNFGVMQAIDILNAILHVKNNLSFYRGGGKNCFCRRIKRGISSKFMC